MPAVHPDDKPFVKGQLLGFPIAFHPVIMAGYTRCKTHFDANTYIRHRGGTLPKKLGFMPAS